MPVRNNVLYINKIVVILQPRSHSIRFSHVKTLTRTHAVNRKSE